MADCGLLDLTCRAGNAATSVFAQIAQAAAQAAVTVIGSAMTWWLHTPSVDPDSTAIHHLQQDLTPIAALILVASILTSMGMITLPPVLISLPFKIMLFVLVDGWHLVIQGLVQSFHT